jgi:teichuronic acid biosynthesis glycosyltransferase TuaG
VLGDPAAESVPATEVPDPLVSVIMPVHNGESYIDEAIESVLSQHGVALELIVIDDGSTDSTRSIVSAIDDPRIRLLSLDRGGVSRARNAGIAAARGEWIAFCDSDDVWLPGRLARQMPQFATADLVTANARFLGGEHDGEPLCSPSALAALRERGLDRLIEGNCIPIGSTSIRRSVALAHPFSTELPPDEDYDLWLRALADGARLAVCDFDAYRYRVHPTSASSVDRHPLLGIARVLWLFAADAPIDDRRRALAVRSAQRYYLRHARATVTRPGMGPTDRIRAFARACRDGPSFNLARWKVAAHLIRHGTTRERSAG